MPVATDRFETIIAEGRKFGLGLCLSHQNLTQLPQSLRQVVLNNVQTQLYFQTGAADAGELAQEVLMDCPRGEIRSALIRQKVGEAFLVRRGQDSVRLRIPLCPDPPARPAELQRLLGASRQAYARPRADVEHELQARTQSKAAPVRTVVNGAAAMPNPGYVPAEETAQPVSPERPAAYQIRHGKINHFKPKGSEPGTAD